MRARFALLMLGAAALPATMIGAKPPPRFQPDPSSVIAAEIAFNRLAQEKGQWTAFAQTAADAAVMFVPQKVVAKDWLKKQANPAASVTWAPSIAYVSCNGNLAASTGNWTQPGGAVGYFTTIWRRDKKGRWQWIMDHGDTLATARATPEFLSGKVATCKRGPQGDVAPPAPGKKGEKPPPPPDESLIWSADITTDGTRHVTVRMWTGAAYETVIDDIVVDAAAKGDGVNAGS